jgi:hypothetical protein
MKLLVLALLDQLDRGLDQLDLVLLAQGLDQLVRDLLDQVRAVLDLDLALVPVHRDQARALALTLPLLKSSFMCAIFGQ